MDHISAVWEGIQDCLGKSLVHFPPSYESYDIGDENKFKYRADAVDGPPEMERS